MLQPALTIFCMVGAVVTGVVLAGCVVQARHDKLGGPRPTLLVVSLHADDTNRAPTFDIDLDDLFNPDGKRHGPPGTPAGRKMEGGAL